MAATRPSLLRQILSIPAEIVVGLYVILDAIVTPLFGPVVRWLSTLRIMKRIEQAIGSLPPYVILVLLIVPFGIAELAKVLGVYLMGTGHFHTGMTIFIGAYVVSIFVCERTFHAGKRQLMTIRWFAVGFNWIMAIRDAMLGWFRRTRLWSATETVRQRARLLIRRLRTRIRIMVGGRPKRILER